MSFAVSQVLLLFCTCFWTNLPVLTCAKSSTVVQFILSLYVLAGQRCLVQEVEECLSRRGLSVMCDSTHAPQLQSWRQELLPSAPPAAPNCKEAFKRTTSGAKWQNSAFVVTCQALNVVLGVLGAGSAVDRERVAVLRRPLIRLSWQEMAVAW